MQKWEYLRLDVAVSISSFSFPDKIAHVKLNGETLYKNVTVLDLQEYIAQLGKDGWELISVMSLSETIHEVFYFKRPLSE